MKRLHKVFTQHKTRSEIQKAEGQRGEILTGDKNSIGGMQ